MNDSKIDYIYQYRRLQWDTAFLTCPASHPRMAVDLNNDGSIEGCITQSNVWCVAPDNAYSTWRLCFSVCVYPSVGGLACITNAAATIC